MAATPTASTSNTAQSIQPIFTRIEQCTDHDCGFASIATIVGKSLSEVMQVAIEKFGHPANGPYAYMDEELFAKIFAHFGFVSTVYKPMSKGLVDLPDVAIALVDYSEEMEIGRHVVFVRDQRNQKAITSFVIDPAYWVDKSLHIRNDFANLKPAWFIGIHPMAAKVSKK